MPGDVITATLGTWLADIEDDALDDLGLMGDGIALIGHDGREMELPPERLSALKKNVIAALRKTLLTDTDGYVIVASHQLPIAKDNRDG